MVEELLIKSNGQWELRSLEKSVPGHTGSRGQYRDPQKGGATHPEVKRLKNKGVDLIDHHTSLFHAKNPHLSHLNTSEHGGLNDTMNEDFHHWRRTGQVGHYSLKDIGGK